MLALKLALVIIAVGLGVLSGLADFGPVEHGSAEFRRRRATWIGLSITLLTGSLIIEFLSYRSTAVADLRDDRYRRELTVRIAALNGSLSGERAAHERETQHALEALDRLQQRLAEIQKSAETERLRNELQAYQRELRAARRALTPGPRARLTWQFVSQSDSGQVLGSPVAHRVGDLVRLRLRIANVSSADAGAGKFWIRLCSGCTVDAIPAGIEHLSAAPQGEYIGEFQQFATDTHLGPFDFDIHLPVGKYTRMGVDLKYSCTNCVVESRHNVIVPIENALPVFRRSTLP